MIPENARNYNNNYLPVLLPKICESNHIKLKTYLHPDAYCGKSCVDGHFTVLWRLVKRYIAETEIDMVTPEDIMDCVLHDGWFKNTASDYIKVNRNYDALVVGFVPTIG